MSDATQEELRAELDALTVRRVQLGHGLGDTERRWERVSMLATWGVLFPLTGVAGWTRNVTIAVVGLAIFLAALGMERFARRRAEAYAQDQLRGIFSRSDEIRRMLGERQ